MHVQDRLFGCNAAWLLPVGPGVAIEKPILELFECGHLPLGLGWTVLHQKPLPFLTIHGSSKRRNVLLTAVVFNQNARACLVAVFIDTEGICPRLIRRGPLRAAVLNRCSLVGGVRQNNL